MSEQAEFANLESAGRSVAGLLAAEQPGQPLLVAVVPNGVPVALGIAAILNWPVVGMKVRREAGGVALLETPMVRGRQVYVVDDGVESGTVARAVAAPLREAGAASVSLAVPACSHERAIELHDHYDDVLAVHLHGGDRALPTFYEDFDTITEAVAEQLLAN